MVELKADSIGMILFGFVACFMLVGVPLYLLEGQHDKAASCGIAVYVCVAGAMGIFEKIRKY